MKRLMIFSLVVCGMAQTPVSIKPTAPSPTSPVIIPVNFPLPLEAQYAVQLINNDQQDVNDLIAKLRDRLERPINLARNGLFSKYCGQAGIPVNECQINASDNTISRKPIQPVSPVSPVSK